MFDTIKTSIWGNSLVVQWLIFQAPNAGGLGSIPSQETRSHMSQQRSKILHAATKTQLCCCCPAAQLCPTLCDPMDCCPPGSSVQGIFLARIQEQVAISFSRGPSQARVKPTFPPQPADSSPLSRQGSPRETIMRQVTPKSQLEGHLVIFSAVSKCLIILPGTA